MACRSYFCCAILLSFMWWDLTNAANRVKRKADFLKALLYDYDYQIPPNYESDQPCNVTMKLFIESFHSISETDMQFVTDVIIEQRWVDPRLDFSGVIESPFFELDTKMMNRIWVPDLYIPNEKSAYFHELTLPNKMLHLHSNGSVVYKARITLTAACYMDLRKYPLDTQICSLYFQSFSYSTSNVVFVWGPNPINNKNVKKTLPKFEIINTTVAECSNTFEVNHTCISVHFHLARNPGFYLLHVYIPSILIVIISWVSFWLSKDAVTARASLGILTILTMTTQTTSSVASLPKVSYIKAIDIWMVVCLGFVFAAFLEYAVLQVLIRRNSCTQQTHLSAPVYEEVVVVPTENETVTEETGGEPVSNNLYCVNDGPIKRNIGVKMMTYENQEPYFSLPDHTKTPKLTVCAGLDIFSRVIFPTSFISFNLFYWIYFSSSAILDQDIHTS
ncbi:hypothetical protein SNE40_016856 [Patella caerulea]|uniref:Uncharacterized protein n=1 Tax=Patella caerulea TaxID=87958 RepID=A0AAN8P8T4_PATCE